MPGHRLDPNKIYAVYHGEKYVCSGTEKEINKIMNWNHKRFIWMRGTEAKKRAEKYPGSLILFELEED